ncbi:MAG: hypothetical protein ACREMU_15050 [Gemmatimonadaceae bacterium]
MFRQLLRVAKFFGFHRRRDFPTTQLARIIHGVAYTVDVAQPHTART